MSLRDNDANEDPTAFTALRLPLGAPGRHPVAAYAGIAEIGLPTP